MKKVDFVTTTYRVSDSDTLYIDLVRDYVHKTYESYIYDITYCIKIYMFGEDMENNPYSNFLKHVRDNYKDYIPCLEEYLK